MEARLEWRLEGRSPAVDDSDRPAALAEDALRTIYFKIKAKRPTKPERPSPKRVKDKKMRGASTSRSARFRVGRDNVQRHHQDTLEKAER